nr:unnamed protein product [Digitaria exilis]
MDAPDIRARSPSPSRRRAHGRRRNPTPGQARRAPASPRAVARTAARTPLRRPRPGHHADEPSSRGEAAIAMLDGRSVAGGTGSGFGGIGSGLAGLTSRHRPVATPATLAAAPTKG